MANGLLIIFGSAIVLSFLTQIINKLMINEKLVDESRDKMNRLQKELKGLDIQSKEFREKQDTILDINMMIMKQQFKPMFATFLPYIIVFYFLAAMFAYQPIAIGSQVHFNVNGNCVIESQCLNLNKTISGKEAFYATVNSSDCQISVNGKESNLSLIGLKTETKLNIDNVALIITPPKQALINLPFNFPLIGNELGWLGTFVIASFVSSMVLTKALKGKYLRKWE